MSTNEIIALVVVGVCLYAAAVWAVGKLAEWLDKGN